MIEVDNKFAVVSTMVNTEPTRSRTRGVLLCAFGSTKYGEMASNIARAIKVSAGYAIKITLVCTAQAIATLNEHIRKTHFDEVLIMDESIHSYKGNNRYYTRTKCMLYELSPYDDTIYLDVDTIWFAKSNINTLFDRLGAEKDEVMWQNSGVRNLLELAEQNERIDFWIAARDILDKFEWKRPFLVQIHSYFIYFRKGEVAKGYFDEVLSIHDRAAEREFEFKDWRQVVPDEMCFAIAYGTYGLDMTDGMQGFKPLFQHENMPHMADNYKLCRMDGWPNETKEESFRKTGKRGFYGATLVVEAPCQDWVVNYNNNYTQFFQGAHRFNQPGQPRCFHWKHKR